MGRARPAVLAVNLLIAGGAGLADVAPDAAGLGAGAGAGVLTANPLIGVVVAMVTRFATAEAVNWVEGEQRVRVQQAVAAAGGIAAPNVVVPWTTAPDAMLDSLYGTMQGHLEVVRLFGGLIACRELLYTVTQRGGLEGTLDTVGGDVESLDLAPEPSPPPSPPPSLPPPAANGAWPVAETAMVLAAVICDGGQGWRWAVSRPASQVTW